MSKYQYKLEPRTYKTMLRVIDEFWDKCVEEKKNPTLNRLEDYCIKGIKQYQTATNKDSKEK